MLHNQFSRGWIGLLVFSVMILSNAPRAEAASKYQVLHSFGNVKDGAGVWNGLAVDSQGDLYGVTTGGGAYGYGTVFEVMPSSGGGWTETILHSFCKLNRCSGDGTPVWDTPLLDSRGRLYDISSAGIFQMVPRAHGWSFKVIYSGGGGNVRDAPPFNDPEEGDLVLDPTGNLYGTFGVGKNYHGGVGELSPGPQGWKEKDLYDFCLHPRNGVCLDGSYPEYSLTWDTASNLYSVTREGGTQGYGVAYELKHTASGWKEHVLYDFPTYIPGSSLTFDSAGNLYGTTFQEGPCDGTVYQLSPQAKGRWKRTILYPFCNPVQNGGAPTEPVIFDPRTGVLYGTASAGGDPACQCGVIFKLSPSANGKWNYNVLHKFRGPDGVGPNGLIIDAKGNLYGTTVAGGKYKYGVAFQFTP